MDNQHAFQVVMLILQGAFLCVVPWVVKVSQRLTKLETLITNGLSSDVAHIKDNCPGCRAEFVDVERRLERLEER